jgi:hypothetical protein
MAIGDAKAFIDGAAAYLIEQDLPNLIREIVLDSANIPLTQACFDLLYHLVGTREGRPEIDCALVDRLLDQLPGSAAKILDLGLSAIPSDATPATRQEFRQERAEWDGGNFQDSYVRTSVSFRCFFEMMEPEELIGLVDYHGLIPRLSAFLTTRPSHEDGMIDVHECIQLS